MVNIIRSKYLHVSIVIVKMLVFTSMHHCVKVQPHRAASGSLVLLIQCRVALPMFDQHQLIILLCRDF